MTNTSELVALGAEIGELVSEHPGRGLAEFRKWEHNPVGFIREVLGGDPWSKQVEIATAVRDSPLVAVASGHACGKDWLSAALALHWVYAKGGIVLCTAPTERQIREIFFREVSHFFREDLPGRLLTMQLRMPAAAGACGILGFTSGSASSYSGFHGARVMVILSEAQGVESAAWDGLLNCATGAEDRVLAIGNPLTSSGRFADCFRGSAPYKRFTISCLEHPNLTGERFIPGGPTAQWVETRRAEYGEGSANYRARVLGLFPTESASGLIKRAWCEDAGARWQRRELLKPDGRRVLAIDPARYGPDASCVAVLQGPHLAALETWQGLDTVATVARVREIAAAHGILPKEEWDPIAHIWSKPTGTIVCDAIGVGAGVADALKAAGYAVREFNAGAKPKDPRFANLRCESFWAIRKALESGKIAFPYQEQLVDELCAIRYKQTAGKLVLESKDSLRQKLGRSTDRGDALAMGWWGLAATSDRISIFGALVNL